MPSDREVVIFDPSGDIFLLLQKPQDQAEDEAPPPVAAEDAANGEPDTEEGLDAPENDDPVADAWNAPNDADAVEDPWNPAANDGDPDDEAPLTADDPDDDAHNEDAPFHEVSTNDVHGDRTDKAPSKPSLTEVELQVSSRHLSLASKVFGHMFSGKSWEHDSSVDRDLVTIPLLEDDYHAMVILLNIIHGQTRSVQRRLPVQTLLQITILINKYEFHEVAEVYTDMWFDHLRPKMPEHIHDNLASWIYICWVLIRPEEYTALTKIAIHEAYCGIMNPDGLIPLPYWINDEIQSRRQAALVKFLDRLSKLLDVYRGPSRRCRREPDCDALALGKLERALIKAALYPFPEPSSVKMSIDDLFSEVRNMDVAPLCKNFSTRRKSLYSSQWDYNGTPFMTADGVREHVGEELQDMMKEIRSELHGLTINEAGRDD